MAKKAVIASEELTAKIESYCRTYYLAQHSGASRRLAGVTLQIVRDNWLSNRIFSSYDDIVDQLWRIMSIGLRHGARGY